LSCPDVNFQELDNIGYEVTMINPLTGLEEPLICEPLQIKLYNDQAVLFCRTGSNFDFSGLSAYKTPLNIRLFYGYVDSIWKNIDILRTS